MHSKGGTCTNVAGVSPESFCSVFIAENLTKEAFLLGIVILTAGIRELTQNVLLLLTQALGNFNHNGEVKVALILGAEHLDTLTADGKDRTGLCSLRDSILDISLQRRNIDLRTERCFGECDRYRASFL